MCNDGRLIKDKRRVQSLIMAILIFLLLTGCQDGNKTVDVSNQNPNSMDAMTENNPKYISETATEDCLLCGAGAGTLLPLYWGEDNIGLISLNTFDLAHIEINRYDDYGKLLEKPAQGFATRITTTGKDGFSCMVTGDTDRGYARCTIYFNKDEFLDIEQSAAHMCTECMNRVIVDDWGCDPTGMAVINFSTRELRLLREKLTAFQFGDYYVSCTSKRDETDETTLEMNLLVFYCPKRYGD